MDDLRGLLYVILAGMFALVGFVIWDRRTMQEMAKVAFLVALMVVHWGPGYAAEEGRLTLEERMIRLETILEERFDAIDQRFNAVDQRFDAIDQRISDLNASIGYIYIMLAAVIALMGVMVSTVVWMARQDRPLAKRHYEQIVKREDEIETDIRLLKKEVEMLKTRLATA